MPFVKDLKDYQTKCKRVKGLQKLLKAKLQTPKALEVITHRAFIEYHKKGITKRLRQEIEAAFLICKKKDPQRSVYVGRAFYVPGIDNPPGLRFSVDTAEGASQAVKKHFDFALKQKYNKKDAQIGVILHPWINPRIPEGGGCVALQQNRKKEIIIEALYGIDEGVQGFPHDIYKLDFKTEEIIEKIIDHKTGWLFVTDQVTVKKLKVAQKYADKQVLSDQLISRIAKDFKNFLRKFKPHRLEFAFQPEGVYYRECVPFLIKSGKKTKEKIDIVSPVLAIKTKEDFNKKVKTRIIFIDPVTIQERKMDLLTQVACGLTDKKIILFPGSASTAHIATVFREAGHKVILIGSQIFKTGEKVRVVNWAGELKVLP
jgi:hypothetical protein